MLTREEAVKILQELMDETVSLDGGEYEDRITISAIIEILKQNPAKQEYTWKIPPYNDGKLSSYPTFICENFNEDKSVTCSVAYGTTYVVVGFACGKSVRIELDINVKQVIEQFKPIPQD